MQRNELIVIILLFFQTMIYSQIGFPNISIPISISVSTGLAINKVGGDLDFGDIIYAGNSFNLTRSPNLGIEFEVTGIETKVIITFPNGIFLDNNDWVSNSGGTRGTMSFIPNLRHTNGNINYIGSANVTSGKNYKLSNDKPYGKLYLWVGGDIRINTNQPYGDYKGTFTITVEY